MDLSKSKITMHWSSHASGGEVQPKTMWFRHETETSPPSDWSEPCHRLFGTSMVALFLKSAFERKLGRFQTWQSQDLSREQQEALRMAARIFKRGVPCLTPDFADRIGVKNSGISTIEFFDDLTLLGRRFRSDDVIVVDANVQATWSKKLPAKSHVIQVSESRKDLKAAAEIADQIPETAGRMVIIGGGVLGDMAGFVAGLKNLRTIYVPTTLLSMSDSSVGGKTGVNAGQWGKNQLGLFHPPEEVWIWSGWLDSLPERELRSGLGEGLKHALLSGDQYLWDKLLYIADQRKWTELGPLLVKIVSVKAAIVERDPFEAGERAILNLGHTMGHAVEALSLAVDGSEALTHGEAVIVGLCHALELSQRHSGFHNAELYIKEIKKSGLIPKLSERFIARKADLATFLTGDKKNIGSSIQWVLMSDFGKVDRTPDGSWTRAIADESASILTCV